MEEKEGGSGWLGIWEGNYDDGITPLPTNNTNQNSKNTNNNNNHQNNNNQVDGDNFRGNIGDWSSFMIAMDDEGGREIHRSMSTLQINDFVHNNRAKLQKEKEQKEKEQREQRELEQKQQQQQPQSRSGTFKSSTGLGLPPTTKGGPLKLSSGIPQELNPNNVNTSPNPLKGSSGINAGPSQNQSSLGKKTGASAGVTSISNTSTTNSKFQLQKQGGNNTPSLAASIYFGNNPHLNFTSAPPDDAAGGSPSTPPLSTSPHLLNNINNTNQNNNNQNKTGIVIDKISPPSVSPSTSLKDETGSFFNLFRKRSKSHTDPDYVGQRRNSDSSNGSTGGRVKANVNGSTGLPSLILNDNGSAVGESSGDDSTPRDVDTYSDVSSMTGVGVGDDDSQFGDPLAISVSSDKILEGWLERWSRSAWKKHWFILRGITLEYYMGWWDAEQQQPPPSPSLKTPTKEKESKEEKEKGKGKITLNYWYSFSKVTQDSDGKFVFSILQTMEEKSKKLKFRCEDEQMARRWVSECENVIKRRKETTVTIRPVTDHRQSNGRRGTVVGSTPPFIPIEQITGEGQLIPLSIQLQFPKELIEDLEPDEKKVLESVKLLLDEFKQTPVPEGETVNSWRNKPKSIDGKYRIFSLDGGGLRSVMVCVLIERIVKRYPTFLDYVDVFTGTSAGSIVAAGLALQYPPKGTRRVLELTALPVFGKKRAGFNMGNAKYFNRVLRAACYVFFQDKKFYEIPRKLVVPAFQLDSEWPPAAIPQAPQHRRWMPQLFHNIGPSEESLKNDWRTSEVVGDALLRSGSAPTFFPSYQGFIDGGVFCNNPAMAAISLAASPDRDNIPLDKMICLSLGTGLAPHLMEGGSDYDWGLLNWAPKLGNLFMGSQVDFLTQMCENMLGATRYHRVNPLLGEHTSMDDPKLVNELAKLANQVDLTSTFDWIEKNWFPPGALEVATPRDSQPLSPRDNQPLSPRGF